MVNRKLDEELERLAKMDHSILDNAYYLSLDGVSEDFMQAISLQLSEQYAFTFKNYSCKYDIRSKEVNAFLSMYDNRQLFIKIDSKNIAFGFDFQVKKDAINLELGAAFQTIEHRYFNEISISNVNDFTSVIQSSFLIDRGQLSNRDFIEYAAFVLDKANLLSAAIIEKNQKQRHSKAA